MKNGLESTKEREWATIENTDAIAQTRQNKSFHERGKEWLWYRATDTLQVSKR